MKLKLIMYVAHLIISNLMHHNSCHATEHYLHMFLLGGIFYYMHRCDKDLRNKILNLKCDKDGN